jgi:ABC-type multidrug transport system ATPase subunit/ABC-type transporter Mla maintaining outer membrane lipid asymmetry permease subunit MlaE
MTNAPQIISAIDVRNLNVQVGGRHLIQNAEFSILRGKLTVLLGISGSGKSTILRILAGLEKPDGESDRIWWQGQINWHADQSQEHVGLVFQQPALLDELSAHDNVQIAIDHRHASRSRNGSANSETTSGIGTAKWWLEHLRVPSNVRISRLSGGQRQRLSLAQTLASQPALLIYDEPTTGLDAVTATQVAQLIRDIQQEEQVTSIVVTHDYESFLPVADQVLMLDAIGGTVEPFVTDSVDGVRLEMDRQMKAKSSQGSASSSQTSITWAAKLAQFGVAILMWLGSIVEWGLLGLVALVPVWRSPRWGLRFFLHFARLVTGGTAIIYLGIAGCIIGFVSTYFTLKYMPYKLYTEPLLMEELLGTIGFALYRIFIPVLTTILIAARCAAAISADLGNKRYGGQYESLRMLGIPVDRYWMTSVVWSFLLGSVLLDQVAFMTAKFSSFIVQTQLQPELGPAFWEIYFHQPLRAQGSSLFVGFYYVITRLLVCGFGTAIITYSLAMRPKVDATDVSRTITTTILWSTLWVLFVHLLISLIEFRSPAA